VAATASGTRPPSHAFILDRQVEDVFIYQIAHICGRAFEDTRVGSTCIAGGTLDP
jgi:hypothetical protein